MGASGSKDHVPVIALVPLRMGGKSRLGAALPPEQRGALVLAMLDDVLLALAGAAVSDVRILAGTNTAIEAAADRGLLAIPDPDEHVTAEPEDRTAGDRRLRAAVDGALAQITANTVRMVVAADLPRLTASEVTSVLACPSDVVVAPTVGGGTSILRLGPGASLPTRYGPGSASAHAEVAQRAGLTVSLMELPGGRHDVDAASDLEVLARGASGPAPGPATAAYLAGARG